MEMSKVTVRPAGTADVASLVELRLANAEAHVALDPSTYRVPQREAVAEYFTTVLAGGSQQDAILVAELAGGRVVGMVEVLRRPEPPDHQILRPEAAAEVHTVVRGDVRGAGVGSALLAAAERWATHQGVRYLAAGIHHRNAGAVRFYSRNGFTEAGLRLTRQLGGQELPS